jgi:hypothetical protein
MTLSNSFALAIAGSLVFVHARPPHVPPTFSIVSDSSIFAPLTLPPAPSATRSANGAPGPKYWQNSADYDLQATIDTVAGAVQGTMTLRYTNHSPNTLPFIWFQTEQNAFRNKPTDTAHTHFGDLIDQFTETVDGKAMSVQLEDHATETKVTLPQPLRPGQVATFHVTWHFIVPKDGGGRMGHEGSLYQIAQWYPRVNVYDDVKGWNIEPYLGEGEFFLEYGNYTLSVTVPSNYIVGATGTLDNPQDVLTPTEIARLAHAAKTDSTVSIVTAAELSDGTAHLKHDGMVTWKFHADNVRDAVFAASPEYQWDATSWKGIIAQAYYRPAAASVWHEVADMGHMSIQEFSTRWFLYPYPQVSVAEGPIGGGMEYPMMSFDGVFPTTTEYAVVTHEIGHEWFPMVVGSNERVHAWMDEGFNSFIDTFSEAFRYPQNGDQTARGDHQRAVVQARIRRHNDFVMDVPADSAPDDQYVAYDKPVGVLQMLRRDIIGPELFDKGLRTYIQRWAYKHPTPQDFFRTMDDVSGQHLDWFWREWFYETPSFDQAIDSVAQTMSGGSTHVTVVYGNHARGVLPLLVRFTFTDSTTQDVTYPADVWRANATQYTMSYTFPKPVIQIVVDPGHHLVDVDRSNNVWPAQKPAAAPATGANSR